MQKMLKVIDNHNDVVIGTCIGTANGVTNAVLKYLEDDVIHITREDVQRIRDGQYPTMLYTISEFSFRVEQGDF